MADQRAGTGTDDRTGRTVALCVDGPANQRAGNAADDQSDRAIAPATMHPSV